MRIVHCTIVHGCHVHPQTLITAFKSTSTVTTDMASRYMQHLCKHFAHKVPAQSTSEEGSITFPFGTCLLGAQGNTLAMTVSAASQ